MATAAEVIDEIKTGAGDRLQALLTTDATLADARDEQGVSGLMLALYYRKAEIAAVLQAARVSLDLFEATAVGDMPRVQALLAADQALVDAYSPDGFTALHFAAFFGQSETGRALLAAGASPNAVARNAMVVQPLHSSAAAGHLAISQALLDSGADVNARQGGGYMPLHEAIGRDDAALVKLFLASGADPSLQLDDGRDAHALAAERANPEVLALLRR